MTRVLDLLSGLSADELREVRARAAALLDGAPSSGTGVDEHDIYQVLVSQLNETGIKAPPLPVAVKMPNYNAFSSAASILSAFVTEHMHSPDRVHRRKAYMVFIKMFIRWMTTIGIPVTMKNVFVNFNKIPAIVRRQFPGYIESGLLHYVISTTAVPPAA